MVMKIENYSGTADLFTFDHNPKTFDDAIDSNHKITPLAFKDHHVVSSGGGVAPKQIVLNGNFSGTDKNTDYLALSKHFMETTKLKKLYWESDKFYLGIGKQIKKTHSGGRTSFIDYVATFETVFGILFGATQKTTGTNAGNVRTYVEEITGTVSSGSSDITISDNHGNVITIDNSDLTTGQDVVVKLIYMNDVGYGVKVSEYMYTTVNGTQVPIRATTGFGLLELDAGENVSTISTTNLTSPSIKFRDGFSA